MNRFEHDCNNIRNKFNLQNIKSDYYILQILSKAYKIYYRSILFFSDLNEAINN